MKAQSMRGNVKAKRQKVVKIGGMHINYRDYDSRRYLQISAILGRLPYIKRNVRNTREASQIATIMETIMIIKLRANCQIGSVPMLDFIITAIGAVSGKRVKIV